MVVFAFLAGYLQLRWGMKQLGIGDDEDASALVFAAGVGGILGAKVYYAILNMDWRLLFDRSGPLWYGGLTPRFPCGPWGLRPPPPPVLAPSRRAAPAAAPASRAPPARCFPGRGASGPPAEP